MYIEFKDTELMDWPWLCFLAEICRKDTQLDYVYDLDSGLYKIRSKAITKRCPTCNLLKPSP
jgi:hypothetical protein